MDGSSQNHQNPHDTSIIHLSFFAVTNMTTVFHLEKLHDELWGPNILWYDVEEDGRVFKLVSFGFSETIGLTETGVSQNPLVC